jgi:HD-like signal output (HDOD) protein
MNLTEILRAQIVKRWSIVNVARHQSVAEHQYNVCMIARALAKKLGENDETIIKAALCHDLEEVLFGDIPTPAKQELRSHGVEVNRLLSTMPYILTEIQEVILKVADLIDAIHFLRDHGLGDHAIEVLHEVEDRMTHYLLRKADVIGSNRLQEWSWPC